MKYPIDAQTAETFFGHLISNDRAQRQMVLALTILLQEAMNEMGAEDTEWYEEAKKIIDIQNKIKVDHTNRIFNEKNGYPETQTPVPDFNIAGMIANPETNAKITEIENKTFGEEMTEEELARVFSEKAKKKAKNGGIDFSAEEPFKGMTLDEIEEWEAKQDNSNDIYKIKARVANAVVATGGALTAVGEMMVNSFVHVAKDLYEFAETIEDKSVRIKLIQKVRKHENMPANLIAAASAGVKVKK